MSDSRQGFGRNSVTLKASKEFRGGSLCYIFIWFTSVISEDTGWTLEMGDYFSPNQVVPLMTAKVLDVVELQQIKYP